jgi:acyl-coenzyme A synthetase/AMP-(fatty) acid ligase
MQKAAFAPKTLRRVADFVALHARRRPGHPAIIRNAAPITYAALAQDLFAVIAALQNFNLRPGAIAAIAHEDLYTQLLLVFGCEALGITTGSFRPQEGPEAHALLELADLVLTSHPRIGPNPASKTFTITSDWLTATLAAPPAIRQRLTPASPTDAEIILRSSGTTGTPKTMSLTYAAMRDRLARQRNPATGLGLNAAARYLALMHFAVGSTYMAASNLLRLGGTFIFQTATQTTPTAPTEKLFTTTHPTHLTLMPFQLRALLASLPWRNAPILPNLTIQTVGAKLPPDLRLAARQKLAGTIKDMYGANEVGAVARVDEAGTLHILPGIDVEIAGPNGAALAPGELGALRIRSPGMAEFYLNDDAATEAMFRPAPGSASGHANPRLWFHPGDLGILTAPGQFTLAGRRNDVLNLGGTKIAAPDLEAKILANTNLRDVALLQRDTRPNQPGSNQAGPTPIIICAVLPEHAPTTQKQLESIITPLLAYPFRIYLLDSIPRTPEGKIQRARLHEKFFPTTQSAA